MPGLSMGISQGQFLTQRFEIRQMLEQYLSLELRQILEQVLKIIEQILQGQVSYRSLQELNDQMRGFEQYDFSNLAHECVRKTRTDNLFSMLYSFRIISDVVGEKFGAISRLSQHIAESIKEHRWESQRNRDRGFVLAQKLIFQPPKDAPRFLDGSRQSLFKLLEYSPQHEDGWRPIRWILAGGWAVELLVDKHLREHHDIDVVVKNRRPLCLDCDTVHGSEEYFGVMQCSWKFLMQQCTNEVCWNYNDTSCYYVTVLCPEFLFLSKILRRPRSQDWEDVKVLVEVFCKKFDIGLIKKLMRRNVCGFDRTKELIAILEMRDPEKIISELETKFV